MRVDENKFREGVDAKMFETFAVFAGALNTKTIDQILDEIRTWTGPEIEAARQALAYRRAMRDPLDWKNEGTP